MKKRPYLAAADRMRTAARAKVDAYGFVQGVCGTPKFNRAGVAAEGQAFFLMMEASAAKADRRHGSSCGGMLRPSRLGFLQLLY